MCWLRMLCKRHTGLVRVKQYLNYGMLLILKIYVREKKKRVIELFFAAAANWCSSPDLIEMHKDRLEEEKESSQALLSSGLARGSRGLLCGSGRAYSIWRRGTSEAGGLCTLCSSAVSMCSVGSSTEEEEASLCGRISSEWKTEAITTIPK